MMQTTAYIMANACEIPVFKIEESWRIKRADFDKWLDAQPRGGNVGRHGE